MKKVLILAYYYPPCNMPGANRPYGWAKYLAENGYFPVVITRSWENEIRNPKDILQNSGSEIKHVVFPTHEVYYVPYKQTLRDKIFTNKGESKLILLRKALTFIEIVLSYFFSSASSFKELFYFSKKILKEDADFKILIATGAPYLLFRFSYLLNKQFGIKWVADYRDDWNTSDIDAKRTQANWLLRKIEYKKEKKWVGSAAVHTAVSPYSVEKNSKFLNKKGFTIHNGYMPEEIVNAKGNNLYEKFTITFIGTLYPTQEIEIFLSAFKEFVARNHKVKNIQILFPGLAFDPVQSLRVTEFLKEFEEFYSISERVPKSEIVKIEQKTHVFLYTAHKMRGIIGSKIYEYVGLKKPVILCPSDNEEIEKIFTETGIGYCCNNSSEVVIALNGLYDDYKSGKKRPDLNAGQLSRVEFYSRRSQAKVLAGVLDEILLEKNVQVPSEKNYQQCTRCVMDTSDAEITFDKGGYCNHCTDYFEKTSKRIYQGTASDLKLTQLVEKIKRAGKRHDYDCVIGISGGVDSLYTAILAKKMGLRVLCVHMDNGWNSELATHNIEKILKKLEMELVTVVLDWEEFRDLQLSFLKASVPEAETPTDIAIPAVLHKVAAKHNVKYILSGGNFATEGILPKSWHYDAKDVKYLKAINKKFGTKKLRTFPTFGFQKEMYYKYVLGIRMVYPLNYVPYNKKEAIKILEQDLGWKNYGGKHHESLYTKFIQSYLLYEKFGIDYRRATFSTQICAGEMTRDEALNELSGKPYNPNVFDNEIEYACKKLHITLGEMNNILKSRPKSFRDYPNNKKILEFIYKIYLKLNK